MSGINNYLNVFNMLPNELKQEENAKNVKKMLDIYGVIADGGDKLNKVYGEMLNIEDCSGLALDLLGAMVLIHRDSTNLGVMEASVLNVGNVNPELAGFYDEKGIEDDDIYRMRILSSIASRKNQTTIPQIQEAINSISGEGNLYVLENHSGYPANIYITGSADSRTIDTSIKTVKSLLPAGVSLIVPIVSFDIWNNIKNQFPTWDSLDLEGYIW